MAKVKIGVFGAMRGKVMVSVLARHPDAELTAVCDQSAARLAECSALAESFGTSITGYTDAEEFLQHDMDAVVLANYATEHAPYAVRLLKSGRHVCSENVACENMAEAVELVEAVESSGKVYTYAENCCYFRGVLELQRLYAAGELGEFLHGEGEYIHDTEDMWPELTLGKRDHWRLWSPSTFYCTHSIGPLLTITGLRPVRLSAYETPNVNSRRHGRIGSDGSVIACQMSNGGTAKFIPWAGYKREPGSLWYAVYGSQGMAETDRWGDQYNKVNVYTQTAGEMRSYEPDFPNETELSRSIKEHGGADFYTMQYFLDAILDRPGKQHAIDIYQALDMTTPGILGFRSICEGNIALEVPDMRDKSIRDRYRNDTWCPDPKYAAPDQIVPSSSFGNPDIPESVYEDLSKRYRDSMEEKGHV